MKAILDNQQHAHRPLDHPGQRPRRDRERFVRTEAVAFARWTARQGLPRSRAAGQLSLRAATLGRWERLWEARGLTIRPLGRPRSRGQPFERLEVVQHLRALGPTVGLPALRCRFPELARSELCDLQREHRCQWFHDHQVFAEVLEWLVPGSVWAMDFSRTPVPIEVDLRHILAVRDLSSHMQLSLLPAQHDDGATAVGALEELFLTHGAPLMAKADRGSAFISWELEALLRRWEVTLLLSPPRWPQYNGSVEAGFGSAKTRIHLEAARNGRVNHWLLDDVEAARLLANGASRPWGITRPTPQQAWDRRTPITPQQRHAFRQAVLANEQTLRTELGCGPDHELNRNAQATVAREAISRALQQLGYLQVTRRPITPPFKLSFRAIIT